MKEFTHTLQELHSLRELTLSQAGEIDSLKADLTKARETVRQQGEFIQKLRKDIRNFLAYGSAPQPGVPDTLRR